MMTLQGTHNPLRTAKRKKRQPHFFFRGKSFWTMVVRSSLVLRQLLQRAKYAPRNTATSSYGQSLNAARSLAAFRSNIGEANFHTTSTTSVLSSNTTTTTTTPSTLSFPHLSTIIPSRYFSSATEGVAVLEEDEAVEIEEDLPRFSDLDNLHPTTAETLSFEGFETMTEIQAKTWEAALSGKDVIGRARTGTGKTMAFLLPSLERALQSSREGQLSVLVVSPTRELANQIGEQARMLTKSHPNAASQVVFGGVSKRNDIRSMERKMPTILAATPGRLLDHLQSTRVSGRPFKEYAQDVDVVILDEMDRLLEIGFKDDIERILSFVPKNRQTLLFSATVPKEVHSMIKKYTKSDAVTIDCVKEHDSATHTADNIKQSHVIIPADRVISGIVQLVLGLMEDKNHKVLVFFPTTSQVAYYATLFNRGLGKRVLEIHSKKSQANRSNTSDRFRQAKRGVMFTSDVSARGVDYPDVTHVIQFGMTSDRETYIHRLGRTGRAGKKGEGILMLLDAERGFLKRDLSDLKIPLNQELQDELNQPAPKHVDDELDPVLHGTGTGSQKDIVKAAESVYRSLFGFYNGGLSKIGVRSKDPLVQMANTFAGQAGLKSLPTLSEKLAKQFGITRHPDVNIRRGWSGGDGFDVGRGGGQGNNRGRGDNDNRGRGGGGYGGYGNRQRQGGDRNSGWGKGRQEGNVWGQDDPFMSGRDDGPRSRSRRPSGPRRER